LISVTGYSKKDNQGIWELYPDSKPYLETWYETVKSANWYRPTDLKYFYAHVSILKNSRVVFNIKGNDYRLVVRINYEKQWLFIRFIGTHQEYEKINANTI